MLGYAFDWVFEDFVIIKNVPGWSNVLNILQILVINYDQGEENQKKRNLIKVCQAFYGNQAIFSCSCLLIEHSLILILWLDIKNGFFLNLWL